MNNPQERRYDIRPTLIVGLGGTGHEVVVRLKAKLADTFGPDIHKIIKLRVFDTADEPKEVRSPVTGRRVKLAPDVELVYMGGIPVSNIVSQIDRHPTIKAWLPPDIPTSSIVSGAHQVRPLGRLSLFAKFESLIKPNVSTAIQQLKNIALPNEVGDGMTVRPSQSFNAFIISSTCGGTGSGTFLDMAYLIRHFAEKMGLNEANVHINGVLVLPLAFSRVNSTRIPANNFAALRELDFFMGDQSEYEVMFPGNNLVKFHHKRPFNICYLVDAANENSLQLVGGVDALAPMIADSIVLQVASQVGIATGSTFDNVQSLANEDQGFKTCYSGMGTSVLQLPVNALIDACGARLARDLLNGVFVRATPPVDELRDEISRFKDRINLDIPKLQTRLVLDPKNNRPLQVGLNAEKVKEFDVPAVPGRVQGMAQLFENQQLHIEFPKVMGANAETIQNEIGAALQEQIGRLLDNANQGVDYTDAFVAGVENDFSAMQAQLEIQKGEIQRRIAADETATRNKFEELRRATDMTGLAALNKGAKVRSLGTDYLNLRNREFRNRLELMKVEYTLVVISNLVNTTREWRRSVGALTANLRVAQQHFAELAERLGSGRTPGNNPLVQDITDRSDVDLYYVRYTNNDPRTLLPQLLADDQMGSPTGWLPPATSSQLIEKLIEFGQHIFSPIREQHIEDVVRMKAEKKTAQERLAELRSISVPFWNFNAANLGGFGAMESIVVIGVEDKDSSIYRDTIRTGEQLASTFDPYSITALHTKHGLPLIGLQQYEEWKRNYDDFVSAKRGPLHIFQMGDPNEDKVWFGMSHALGFIREIGVRFSFTDRPGDRLLEPVELDSGLEAALNAFIGNAALVSRAKAAINLKIEQMGKATAAQELERYVNSEFSVSKARKQIETELRLLVRTWAETYL